MSLSAGILTDQLKVGLRIILFEEAGWSIALEGFIKTFLILTKTTRGEASKPHLTSRRRYAVSLNIDRWGQGRVGDLGRCIGGGAFLG